MSCYSYDFVGCERLKSLPLLYLMTKIVPMKKGIQITEIGDPIKPIQAKCMMKCNIPSFCTSEIIPKTHPFWPRPLYSQQDWDEWIGLAKVTNPGW